METGGTGKINSIHFKKHRCVNGLTCLPKHVTWVVNSKYILLFIVYIIKDTSQQVRTQTNRALTVERSYEVPVGDLKFRLSAHDLNKPPH